MTVHIKTLGSNDLQFLFQSAIGEDMFFASGIPFDDEYEMTLDGEVEAPAVCPLHPTHETETATPEKLSVKDTSRKRLSSDTLSEWSTYGIALMTFGLGLAYSYLKSQD